MNVREICENAMDAFESIDVVMESECSIVFVFAFAFTFAFVAWIVFAPTRRSSNGLYPGTGVAKSRRV